MSGEEGHGSTVTGDEGVYILTGCQMPVDLDVSEYQNQIKLIITGKRNANWYFIAILQQMVTLHFRW